MPTDLSWTRVTCANSACVEVALDGPDVLMRVTGQPWVILRMTGAEWQAFTAAVRADWPAPETGRG